MNLVVSEIFFIGFESTNLGRIGTGRNSSVVIKLFVTHEPWCFEGNSEEFIQYSLKFFFFGNTVAHTGYVYIIIGLI